MNGYLANLYGSNRTLTITTNEIETESRAVILEVSVDGEIPTEAEVLALAESEKKNLFIKAVSIIWNWPEATWEFLVDYIDDEYGETVTTAEEAYTQLVEQGEIDNSEYISFYNLLLETGAFIPSTTFSCNEQNVVAVAGKSEFIIAKNGSYIVTATNAEGTGTTSVNITHCKIEEFSAIQTTKQTLTIDGFTVTIPAGFAYGTSANVGHVTSGLVITDSVEVVNGKNYSNGNEFVWVPVDENLKVGTASNNKLMARISSGTNYQGVLYWFSGTGNSSTSTELGNVDSRVYREPAYLSDNTYADASSYNTIGITQNSLQTEYNSMIASIKTNKGFYVGRYEMGIENGNAVSKLGITPASAHDGCTNEETGDGALRWYGLYNAAKNYTNSSNSVQAHMICGAEYDAMLNYALEGSDKGKVTSIDYGNYGEKIFKTGTTQTSDKINNIYDLGGNMSECITEACGDDGRVVKGGCIYSSSIPAGGTAGYSWPSGYQRNDTSRVALYIK